MPKPDSFASGQWTGVGSVRPGDEQSLKRSPPSDIKVEPDVVKRRRLYEEERAAIAAGRARKSDAIISTPQRTSTVPRAPSPAQNAINGSPSSTHASGNKSATTKMTASAAFLASVLEKVSAEKVPTRLNHPDVANPYEEEAIVKPKIKPMEKLNMTARRERTKAMLKGREEREEREKREAARPKGVEKKDFTAREVIEASIPKDAKRSRPPPGVEKGKGTEATPLKSIVNEEDLHRWPMNER